MVVCEKERCLTHRSLFSFGNPLFLGHSGKGTDACDIVTNGKDLPPPIFFRIPQPLPLHNPSGCDMMEKTSREEHSMASKKVGTLIKEARTEAGLTQEQLARRISGLSANDISLAEWHQKNLTQEQLKQIAKITGVTQASLLSAAKGTSAKKTSGSKSSMQVTAAERRLVELYREADTETRKDALKVLRGQDSLAEDILESLMDSVQDMLSGK